MALAFQDCTRQAPLFWNGLAFQKLNSTMLAQPPEYLPYPEVNLAVQNLPAILRDN